jgi:hypothetical protein
MQHSPLMVAWPRWQSFQASGPGACGVAPRMTALLQRPGGCLQKEDQHLFFQVFDYAAA